MCEKMMCARDLNDLGRDNTDQQNSIELVVRDGTVLRPMY